MTDLTESDKKLLTEYLGEKWVVSPYRVIHCDTCTCGSDNRPFDSWTDFGDLIDKIKEREEWDSFTFFAAEQWGWEEASRKDVRWYFTEWLLTPARIPTIAEWVKSRGGK